MKKLKLKGKVDAQMLFGLAVAVVGITVIMAALMLGSATKTVDKTSVSLADPCQQNNTVTYSCYRGKLQSLVNQGGPEAAFKFIKAQSQSVPYVKSQCHQLAHVIGRASYARYGNLTDTFAHGDQFCWSGYYHGVMEQVTADKGADYTIKNAASICQPLAAKRQYGFYHFNCVHGLGHGFMLAQNQDVFKSLSACDRLNNSWESNSCYGGVFMQNIMNVQSPDDDADHTSKFLKPEEPMYPCTAVADKYKDQCYLSQTSYVLQVDGYDFAKVFEACGQVEVRYRSTCYQSAGRDVSGQSVYDADKARAGCLAAPTDEARSNCFIGLTKDFVSNFHGTKEAYQICQGLTGNLLNVCTSTIRGYYAGF